VVIYHRHVLKTKGSGVVTGWVFNADLVLDSMDDIIDMIGVNWVANPLVELLAEFPRSTIQVFSMATMSTHVKSQ
jgi:hypothetical protein